MTSTGERFAASQGSPVCSKVMVGGDFSALKMSEI